MSFPLTVPYEYQSNIQIRLRVVASNGRFGIRNAKLVSGKFYSDRGPSHNMTEEEINTETFADGDMTTVNACNRSSAFYGTEGSFDIARSGEKVATVRWAIPLGGDGPPLTRDRHPPVSRTQPTADVQLLPTKKGAYHIDVDGLEFAPWESKSGNEFWQVHTHGTISLKIFRTTCLLKIRNDLKERMVLVEVTHKNGISRPYGDGTAGISPDTTLDWLIGISDGEDGELDLHFSYVPVPARFVPDSDPDYGTFKCKNLRSPSEKNAIGISPQRIDVTSTTHNDTDSESEIHIHVR